MKMLAHNIDKTTEATEREARQRRLSMWPHTLLGSEVRATQGCDPQRHPVRLSRSGANATAKAPTLRIIPLHYGY